MANNTPVSLRIPPEFKDFIKEDAKANHRSISGEINYLIEKGIKVAEIERKAVEAVQVS